MTTQQNSLLPTPRRFRALGNDRVTIDAVSPTSGHPSAQMPGTTLASGRRISLCARKNCEMASDRV
jgi:hypothetical protein